MKKLLALTLAGAMLLSLAACGGSESSGTASGAASGGTAAEAPAEGEATDTLHVILPRDPGTLENGKIDDKWYYQSLTQIYEPLFRLDNDGNLINWLAESHEFEDDTHLVLHLRDVKFSDGTQMTAEDVLWSLKRNQDETLPSISQIMDVDFEQSAVIDEKTVRLVTTKAAPTLPYRLAYPGLGVTSKAAYDASGGDWLGGAVVGTGPYKLVKYVAGDRLELTANENYWREGEPYMKNLQLRFILDDTTRSTESRALGADIIVAPNQRELESIDAVDGVHVDQVLSSNTVYLMLNSKQAPLDNPTVREAVTYAVNIPQTVQLVYGDFGSPGSGMVAPGILGYDETMFESHFGHGYDPEKAKELLAEAGYPDGITLEILVETGDTARNEMAEAFQAQMAPAGITLNITQLENVVLYDRVNNGQDYYMSLYGLTCSDFEADSMLNQLLPGSSSIKYTNFDDPTFLELIEESGSVMDRTEREAAYKEALNYLAEANVMIPVWHKALACTVKDNVEGFTMSRAFEEHEFRTVKVN